MTLRWCPTCWEPHRVENGDAGAHWHTNEIGMRITDPELFEAERRLTESGHFWASYTPDIPAERFEKLGSYEVPEYFQTKYPESWSVRPGRNSSVYQALKAMNWLVSDLVSGPNPNIVLGEE